MSPPFMYIFGDNLTCLNVPYIGLSIKNIYYINVFLLYHPKFIGS